MASAKQEFNQKDAVKDSDTGNGANVKGKRIHQYVASFSVTLGAFALGTVYSWSSPAVERLQQGKEALVITKEEGSWVGAIINLGAGFMMVVMAYTMDRLGRKQTMLIVVVPFVLGWALLAFSESVAMLLVGRFVTGMAGGAFSVAAPVYIGEVTEKEVRGRLGTLFQIMVCSGILFVYIVGAYVSVRWLSVICGVLPLIFGTVFLFMPESPLSLLKRDKREKAVRNLKWLRGPTYDVDSEIKVLEAAIKEAENDSTFKDIWSSRAARRGITIAFGLMIFQQLTGINAIIFYTVNIFENAGSSLDKNLSTIIVGATQVVATFVSALVVDRLGRRPLLLVSYSVMAVCQGAIGVYFHMQSAGGDVKTISWLPLVSLVLFIVAHSLGNGPIPWLMIGELFPPRIKGTAGSASCLIRWILIFLVTKFFVDIQDALGSDVTFWIFSVMCIFGAVFVFITVIETKGKSLEEIQNELEGEISDTKITDQIMRKQPTHNVE